MENEQLDKLLEKRLANLHKDVENLRELDKVMRKQGRPYKVYLITVLGKAKTHAKRKMEQGESRRQLVIC